MTIRAGEVAPDFELADQNGDAVRLSSLRGRSVVIYFYPAAMTPGCTLQACGIRDRHDELEAAGAVVLGVSPDKPKRLRRFAGTFNLPFTLLSDPDHAVAKEYGTWGAGRSLLPQILTERTTFVIGPDGRVVDVLRKVNPLRHDELVLAALARADADGAAGSALLAGLERSVEQRR
ncbi:MAG TPA: thioredoxin-dependent thiol peroxidase [Thermoleophilaceae bacterium]|nr:thioredoxin-dependent thiol peroxidase [Thermoleophilaceae bacterium]